jgi:hypothetical protein
MKQLSIFFVLIIFIVPTLESQNLFDLDENYGFKGYKFQISKSSFGNEEFENVENGGAEKCSITVNVRATPYCLRQSQARPLSKKARDEKQWPRRRDGATFRRASFFRHKQESIL